MVGFPTTDNLDEYWNRARSIARTVKDRSQQMSAAAAAGGVQSITILDYATFLADQKLALQACIVSGIVAYAQAQMMNPTADITTLFNTMITAIQNTVDWIVTNFPKDAGGFLLAVSFVGDGTGRTTPRLFTSGDLGPFKTVVDALLATLE
jgi:hypothetical protein